MPPRALRVNRFHPFDGTEQGVLLNADERLRVRESGIEIDGRVGQVGQ